MSQNNFNKKIIGITGGIASGKSLVGEILKKEGYLVIDADETAKRLNKKGGRCFNAIIKEFGKDFLDESGEIDKKKFGTFIFKDETLTKRLNLITHPIISGEINKEIKKADNKMVFVLVPLLFESGMQQNFDAVWTVSASEDIRIGRAKLRSGMTADEVKNIIKNQISEIERNKLADNIIYNEGKADDLKAQVLNVLKTI